MAINNSPDLVTEAIKLTCTDKKKIRLIALKVLPLYEGELHLTGIGNLREVIDGGKDEYVQAVKKSPRRVESPLIYGWSMVNLREKLSPLPLKRIAL